MSRVIVHGPLPTMLSSTPSKALVGRQRMLHLVLSLSLLCMLFASHVIAWHGVTLVEVCYAIRHPGLISSSPHSPAFFLHLGIPQCLCACRPDICVLAVHTS